MSTNAAAPRTRRPRVLRGSVVAACAVALVVVAVLSIGVGATVISWRSALVALADPAPSQLRSLVLDVRLPRVVLAALVGAGLAVAGLLAQALTRNPLASAQTFGINAGAAVAIVLATIAFPGFGGLATPAALLGAGVVGLVMWWLSTTGSVTVVGLALAGMTIQIVLSAVVQAVLIMNSSTQDIVYWLAGSVTGAQWGDVALLGPVVAVGCLAALAGSRSFALLSLDAATAGGLGQRQEVVTGVAALLVVLLAGAAVAVAGPIGFVGLIVPHLVRRFAGPRFAAQTVACIVVGALLLVAADLVAKLIAFPAETPAGIITALVGAPVFLVLAVRARRS